MASTSSDPQTTPAAANSPGSIVVGLDGSAAALAALEWAAVEAKVHGRPLTVVFAPDPGVYYGYPVAPMAALQEAVDASGEAILDEALAQVFGDKQPARVTRVVCQGNPAGVLIDVAQDASMLVVGARGHGHFLMGSVSDRCVHHAHCPVVVVR